MQHVLVLLLGLVLLQIVVTGGYLRYVRPGHAPLLVFAGAALAGLALVALVRDARDRSPDHDHEHRGVERHAPWLLLAPVLTIALVPPPALGSDAVLRSGRAAPIAAAGETFAPLPPSPLVELTLGEFVQRAVWDRAGSLDGRQVSLTGFVVRRGPDTELARLTILCCAADARPNRVRLVGYVDALPADTWLRVRGSLQPGSAGDIADPVPAVVVTEVTVIEAPADPYEY